MIEHIKTTGDTGRMKIEDYTDNPNTLHVVLYLQSTSPVAVDLRWAYNLGADKYGFRTFQFQATTVWQRVAQIYVGTKSSFTFRLANTGVPQLGGPTDQSISLAGGVEEENVIGEDQTGGIVQVYVNGAWRPAKAYVNDKGTWKLASPYIRTNNGWIQLS